MPLTFDHIAPIYDHFMLPFERGALRRWREMLWKKVRGGRVLEVGIGTGANLPLYPENATLVGLDRSRKMLLRAKAKGVERVVVGDVMSLPFRDGTFDSVVSTLVFCSVRDPVAGLREILRVLVPGGEFHMIEHVRPEDWKGRLFDLLNPITVLIMEEYINRRTHELVGRVGFVVVESLRLTSDGLFRYVRAKRPS